MTLAQAIADYHALLDPALAAASWQRLTEEMRARQLYFGERPLSTVLRPRLITASQYDLLRRGTQHVAEAARAIVAASLENNETGQAVRDILMLTPLEERLIAMHPGYLEPSAHSRMDTFLTVDGSSLQFVEYNAESPAAIAYEDLLAQAFLAMPVMAEFAKRYPLIPLPARPYMLRTLMDCWRAAGSPGHEPRVAIVDWRGVPTATEFEMFRRYFNEHGLPAVICAPQDLAFHDGQLWARLEDGSETLVTIVFKRVLTSEFLTHYGDDALSHPLVQAYAAGVCVIVNSFRAKLLHKKSLFALLSDERFYDPLSAEQRAAVAAHVPWTRVVRPSQTTYQGETIDLLAFARANRERLLLKPNDEYGGKGITIGWEVSVAEWEAALNAALAAPFVVQERVTIAYEPYPALVDGQVVIGERLVDSDPFLFGTEVNGCLCRLSTVTLLNVTAGGGSTVPVFVIDG
ncbi:circularly permuted type 2 ATP-grasp protein [Chloroflexus sp.]|uniref:circularly permuted type 2 ATP-grasp protein n=1 Tax=Chloroflexus sp. TaxID=1904827 RepID=UPI002ACE5748|nr:circularly permuted type 2 ATP-grasp protein [Chloroflexus sp.]